MYLCAQLSCATWGDDDDDGEAYDDFDDYNTIMMIIIGKGHVIHLSETG